MSEDEYNCAAIIAYDEYKAECPEESEADAYAAFITDFAYLMRFQEGYESSLLGKDTVMHRWKQKGRILCLKMWILGKHPQFPKAPEARAQERDNAEKAK